MKKIKEMLPALLIGFFIGGFAGQWFLKRSIKVPTAQASMGALWNRDRRSVFNELSIVPGDIVFVGNSLMEGFPLTEMFPGLPVKNRGIGWNESRHVVGRIADIAKYSPAKIFVEMGINDFIAHVPVDSVFMNFQETVAIIQRLSPQTAIYIQSVTPNSMSHLGNQSSIIALNDLLKAFCRQMKLHWVNLYPLFYKDGGLDSAYTFDGIHPNGKGYLIWKGAIDTLVKQ